MDAITDDEAQVALRWALAKLVATSLFWGGCVAVVGLGGLYVVAQRGAEYGVPLLILLFTFGSGAWFWIRETHISWSKARAAAGVPTR